MGSRERREGGRQRGAKLRVAEQTPRASNPLVVQRWAGRQAARPPATCALGRVGRGSVAQVPSPLFPPWALLGRNLGHPPQALKPEKPAWIWPKPLGILGLEGGTAEHKLSRVLLGSRFHSGSLCFPVCLCKKRRAGPALYVCFSVPFGQKSAAGRSREGSIPGG